MDSLPLKDIHLPEAIGWWPPAPGWWLLPIVLALLAVGLRYVYKRLTQKTALKSAKNLLKSMRLDQTNNLQTLSELSVLLRRTAISIANRNDVASLHGQAWLDYLDGEMPDRPFSQGVGRCLADAHYRPTLGEELDLPGLFDLCERWLKQQAKKT